MLLCIGSWNLHQVKELGKAMDLAEMIAEYLEADDIQSYFGAPFGAPFGCYLCPAEYNFKSELERHMIQHSSARASCCTMCDKKFKHPGSLTRHMRKSH